VGRSFGGRGCGRGPNLSECLLLMEPSTKEEASRGRGRSIRLGKRSTQRSRRSTHPCTDSDYFAWMTVLHPNISLRFELRLPLHAHDTSSNSATLPRPIPFLDCPFVILRSFFARRAADLQWPYLAHSASSLSQGTLAHVKLTNPDSTLLVIQAA
jgi:hypothetical protein